MPKFFDVKDGSPLGEVAQEDLDLLVAQLEETSSKDRDYYVDNDTFLRLVEAGASAALLDAVKIALDRNGGEADIRWEPD
jgi:hypothetical protein